MVISEDPWHLHLVRVCCSGAVTTCLNDSVAAGYRTINSRMPSERSFTKSPRAARLRTPIKTTWLNTFIKYVLCVFYLLCIRLLSWNKRENRHSNIGTKLQLSCINSPESAVCHVAGVDNVKHFVCLRNHKSSTISDYPSKLM